MAKAKTKKSAARKVGRPGLYRPEFVEQARQLCELGATDLELAAFFKINVATLNRWKNQFPEFCASIKVGKDAADDRVERALFNRATGYTFDSEKIMTVAQGGGVSSVERVKIKEHVPPDVTAQIFWLKNRRKDQWRDRVENTHSGPDGGPMQVQNTHELGGRLAFALRKGLEAGK